jgi:hypothetical protein
MPGQAEPVIPKRAPWKRRHAPVKPPLLTRSQLDGRTNIAKAFNKLVADIYSDLGGRDRLSAIELALVEAFAGAACSLDALNARILLGEKIDLSSYLQASSTMVRIGSRLGLQRRSREIPALADYLEHKARAADADDVDAEAAE